MPAPSPFNRATGRFEDRIENIDRRKADSYPRAHKHDVHQLGYVGYLKLSYQFRALSSPSSVNRS